MANDLLAEFISRSRVFAGVTRGLDLMKQAADALRDVFDVDSGFFFYQKQLVLMGTEPSRVYEPWGMFRNSSEELQIFLDNHQEKVIDLFTKAHDMWMRVEDLPIEFQSLFKVRGIEQAGVFALRSRGKVTGCIVLGRTRSTCKNDEGILTACATQIALMLDMLAAWRLTQTNEKKYQSLIENNPDAIFELNVDGRLVAVNPAMEKITGYTKQELLFLKRGALIAPEDMEKAMQHEKRVLEGFPQTYEVAVIHKDGHRKYLSMNRVPIQVDGMMLGVFGIAKDITEQKLAQELLRKSEKLAVVGQLAAGVAHEIRNPLTSLKGFVQLLSESKENETFCEIMLTELNRINEIVSEFLVIAKPQVQCFEQEDINVLVQDVVSLISAQGTMNNVQISIHDDERIPPVFCDKNQIKQVFLNVLKNALESIPKDGAIEVFVEHRELDHKVVVRFKDNGCGIPQERITRLGEPFYTTKEKGTGLGLMVSYKILEAHEGKIEIQSKVGKGTTVDVILPCASHPVTIVNCSELERQK